MEEPDGREPIGGDPATEEPEGGHRVDGDPLDGASVTTREDLVVRPMVAEDVDRVAAIERSTFSSAWQPSTFVSLLDRPGAEMWVMEHPEDGVIGYSVLWCILDQGELANIAIAEGHRGRGLGRYLFERMMDVGRERGVESVYLEVRESNQAAIALYERFGFAQIGVRRRYYSQPTEDALVMLMRL